MWLDVCGSILWRENEVYHLAVWPSSHVVRTTECARHPAAPAEPLAFARLEDESVPLLLRQYALRNLPQYTNHINNCEYNISQFHTVYKKKIKWIKVAISCTLLQYTAYGQIDMIQPKIM